MYYANEPGREEDGCKYTVSTHPRADMWFRADGNHVVLIDITGGSAALVKTKVKQFRATVVDMQKVKQFRATVVDMHPQYATSILLLRPGYAERLRDGGGFCQFHWYRIIFPHCPPGRLAVESG